MISAIQAIATMTALLMTHQTARIEAACTAAYLDLGTNIGVQLRKLFEPHLYRGAPMLALFDACLGPAPKRLRRVCAFGFEANPIHTKRLRALQSAYRNLGWNVTVATETLVGDREQVDVPFFDRGDVSHEHWGGSIFGESKHSQRSLLHQIDIAAFIELRVRELGFPIALAKFDIEGSEFLVLPHLLERNLLCDNWLGTLTIEWHQTAVPPEQRAAAVEFHDTFAARLARQSCPSGHRPTRVVDFDDETYLHDSPAPLPTTTLLMPGTTAVAIGVYVGASDDQRRLAVCQRDKLSEDFPNVLLLADDGDRQASIERIGGALPRELRSSTDASRKNLMVLVDLYQKFPDAAFFVVLGVDAKLFTDALLALLNERRRDDFVAGYVQQQGEAMFGGLVILSSGALRRIVSRQIFLSCILALEDRQFGTNVDATLTKSQFTAAVDRYVPFCASQFEFGPRVPLIDLHAVGFRSCAQSSTTVTNVTSMILSCHHHVDTCS